MSFGIIEMVLAVLFRHLGQDPANAKLIYAGAMTGLTFILAVLLHVAVETPCRRLGDRLLTPRPPLAAAAQRL
jgi:peptidoglycan/LPS O-acetylase OafA/YrhL